MTTFLLVHGAWHNSLHWTGISRHLILRGHRAVPLDLPGHGIKARFPVSYLRGDWSGFLTEPAASAEMSLDDAANSIVETIEALEPHGKITLVGHSAAGNAISRAAELAHSRVNRLVYISAVCPTLLHNAPAYANLAENPAPEAGRVFVADAAVTGAFRINPRSPDPTYLKTLHTVFYGCTPYEDFLAHVHAMTPDQPKRLWLDDVEITRERWGRVPRSFVRCLKDRALPLDVQDRMIRDADEWTPGNRFSVHDLDTDHSPFASSPAALSGILEQLA